MVEITLSCFVDQDQTALDVQPDLLFTLSNFIVYPVLKSMYGSQ